MPMARRTSALRRTVSESALRWRPSAKAASTGLRDRISVPSAISTRTAPPTVAVQPMAGWKAKQIVR